MTSKTRLHAFRRDCLVRAAWCAFLIIFNTVRADGHYSLWRMTFVAILLAGLAAWLAGYVVSWALLEARKDRA